ncbi:MAG: LysR family transcriptional regulator [Pseudomonadota bacterium]
MNRLEEMQIYLRVAEMASFTKAAQSLQLPKASASNAVRQLESALGTRLLHRTTRQVQMTQDGMAFYERCKDVLADVEELETMFEDDDLEISGRLRVDMPIGLARHVIVPRLPEFLATHPRLQIELSSTDRRVDLVAEGFDCVIRVGALGDSALIARPLGQLRQLNCASPAYVARRGTPRTIDDLARHDLIHYVASLGNADSGFEYLDAGQVRTVKMGGAVTVSNSDAYQAACLAGLGIIQAPETGVGDLIVQGQLVELLPDYQAPALPVSLLYANRRHLPKRAQRFMAWVSELMRAYAS